MIKISRADISKCQAADDTRKIIHFRSFLHNLCPFSNKPYDITKVGFSYKHKILRYEFTKLSLQGISDMLCLPYYPCTLAAVKSITNLPRAPFKIFMTIRRVNNVMSIIILKNQDSPSSLSCIHMHRATCSSDL